MNRKTQVLIGLAGAAAGFCAIRSLGGKRIYTFPYGYGIKLKKEVVVDCSAEQLYSFWRNLSNLSNLCDNVLSVQAINDTRSQWTLRAPGGLKLEWDADITVDRRNEMIGWRSLHGAEIDNAGYVRFEPAAMGRGTIVRVALQYNPPAGKLGAALSSLLGEKPSELIEQALQKFKDRMEAEEIRSRPSAVREPVETASEDSFPASDAPAWTGTTGPIT
jgi:uncharacterized membrane protein